MGFDWAFFIERIVNPGAPYLNALGRTVTMAVLAMLLGLLIGLVVGFGRLSRFAVIRSACAFYVWFIRGIPVLVLLVMLFSGMAAAGLFRFSDIEVFGLKLTASFQAAVIGLAIHEGAYMAEIVRNGVQSVARGQVEAAKSLGMSPWLVTWRIVIPQATRVIVPPFGNDFNHMLKTTSLASVIGVQEIFLLTEAMSATTFKSFELLSVVALNYLVLTAIWNTIQGVIETRLRAHEIDRPVRTWWQSLLVYLSPGPSAGERRA
jgi:polar amino acid transport system permease protein